MASRDFGRVGRRTLSDRAGDHLLLLIDIGAGVLLAPTLVMADTGPGASHAHGVVWALRIVGIVGACLAIPFRRFYPRPALIASTVSAAFVMTLGGVPLISVAVAIIAYAAANIGSLPAAWWVTPATLSGVLATAVAIGQPPSWFAAILLVVAIVCMGWFAGQAAKERRNRLLATAERQAAQMRQAATDERLIIARELHDIVAHAMSVIAIRSGVARVVMDDDPAEVKEALGIIETTTRRALQEMRLLVEVLRHDTVDAALRPAPGLADLPVLTDQIRRAGVDLEVDVSGTVRPLPPGVDLSAYRITQEALTNVVRHAGPTRATVRIEYLAEEVVIMVTDEGPAADHARVSDIGSAAGHGLIGMAERVALFDGQLETGRTGSGFQVRARLRTDEESP